jgi:hypothetical protein
LKYLISLFCRGKTSTEEMRQQIDIPIKSTPDSICNRRAKGEIHLIQQLSVLLWKSKHSDFENDLIKIVLPFVG